MRPEGHHEGYVYIFLENADGFGGSPKDIDEAVHGVFFDQRRAEDFVEGMIGYMNRYDGGKAVLVDGKARSEDAVFFEIIKAKVR